MIILNTNDDLKIIYKQNISKNSSLTKAGFILYQPFTQLSSSLIRIANISN